MPVVWILIGLVALVLGAEILVRGASGLARAAGMTPLVIGLTVVAFGTSTPEFAVSAEAALTGRADIGLGNVVGSNVCNILLILGLSALIAPLSVSAQLVRFDVPVMIGVSFAAWAMAADGAVSRLGGGVLVAALATYTGLLIWFGRRKTAPAPEAPEVPGGAGPKRPVVSVALVLAGLALLVVGAGWLVDGAAALARLLGMGELIIGLTIVAAGTSAPELATSVVASLRGQRDIAVGNVVGSNIFNLLGVLGGAALLGDGMPVAPTALRFDIPVMVAVALACLPIFLTGGRISRWEGAVFGAYYVAYVTFLILAASRHAATGAFTTAMLGFAIPLTVLGIAVSVVVWWRRRHACGGPAERL